MNTLHGFFTWVYTRPPILLQGARHLFWRLMAWTGWPMPTCFLWADRRVNNFILWWMDDPELRKAFAEIDAKHERTET